jgi:hypothetical protein
VKARNHSQAARALLPSKGVTYKPATVKSRRAREWGGWGRLSDDGPGHYNPDRSEGPWGRATAVARTAVIQQVISLRHRAELRSSLRWSTKGEDKLDRVRRMTGADLTRPMLRKVSSERLALKPYWGKPAVRNFREVGGNGATGCATRARSWKRPIQTSTRLLGHRASCLLGNSARPDLWGPRGDPGLPDDLLFKSPRSSFALARGAHHGSRVQPLSFDASGGGECARLSNASGEP